MQYKLKFASGGDVRSWRERSVHWNPWTHSTKPFGFINGGGADASWQIGGDLLILESHHLSDIITGLSTNFHDMQFNLPRSSSGQGVSYIQHQYWQSSKSQSTLRWTTLTSPSKRKIAEKIEHMHRIMLGTRVFGRSDWSVNTFAMLSITGDQLALAIAGHRDAMERAENVVQDVVEEAVDVVADFAKIFTG